MDAARRRAVRLISAVVVLAATTIAPAVLASSAAVNHVATCPPGMVANPGGYGCVPDLAPGGGFVGAPSQDLLTRCNGNYYICIWPYPVP